MSYIENQLEIILITYNRKKQLGNTLEQIFSEDSPIKNFDIKILDNHSTDGSSEFIEEYAKKFPKIKHIVHNRNIGGNGNIARAFELASKKYVWVICDDDSYDWRYWSEIEQAISQDYDVIFTQKVKTDIANIYHDGTFVPACIYKTENITETVMTNMLDNIRNMFPQLAILSKNINENKKFFFPSSSIVIMGVNQDGYKTYIRGQEEENIPQSRKNLYWAVGYLNSIELINDRKKQIEIINNLRHFHNSLYDFFKTKIYMNKVLYKDYFRNYYQMFSPLTFTQKIKFIIAYIFIHLKYLFINTEFLKLSGDEKWIKYFKFINQEKHIKKLATKLKNKKVLIYGAGIVSEILFDNYNMSKLNIIGVADRKFEDNSIKDYKGYKAIPPSRLKENDFDVILFALYMNKKVAIKIKKQLKGSKNIKIIDLIKRNIHIAI